MKLEYYIAVSRVNILDDRPSAPKSYNGTERASKLPRFRPSHFSAPCLAAQMSETKFLHYLKPFAALIPDVSRPRPGERVKLTDKLLYTAVALFVFLVCSQLPLYGVKTNTGSDPFYWARMIMASSRGTCMELGIGPIITSGMIMQLLVGSKVIDMDPAVKEDKAVFEGVQRLLAMLITVGQALAYVFSGMYGSVKDLGPLNATLIIAQLVFAGFAVMLLDELLQHGYGLGSGISLFIATNTCEMVIWQSFSPHTITRETGTQFEGAVVSLVSSIFTEKDKIRAIKNAFYRSNAPNLSSLLGTGEPPSPPPSALIIASGPLPSHALLPLPMHPLPMLPLPTLPSPLPRLQP